MDVVLGVSVVPAAPSTVRMVLVEGENADGATVDHDGFEASRAPDQVIAAILGTRESAQHSGYHVASTGVTFTDQLQAAALADALAAHRVENVMLISAFVAAAALARAVGGTTNHDRTGLLFIEPHAATLAVVDTADGSVAEVRNHLLSGDDDAAVGELAALVAGAELLETPPAGVLVVGAGVDVAMIKPALDAATSLPVSVPDEPDMALARGAALASAHASPFGASTHGAGSGALAYSATPDGPASGYLPIPGRDVQLSDPGWTDSRQLDFTTSAHELHPRSFALVGGAVATLFVVGVGALALALATTMRPSAAERPNAAGHVVVPAQQAPPPAKAPMPAPKPAPAPVPQAPEPQAPAPQAPAPQAPVEGPASPPVILPPVIPPLFPPLEIPGLPGVPPIGGPTPGGGDRDHGGGHGRGHGRGGIPGIPGIPGFHFLRPSLAGAPIVE